ncbi:amine oxidase [Aspergillus steynii IBT 23096]|uniref:Amine oxidase n=1 Tax=Aspergillus steynii IBT 23096 TaxID=1392250 RepID=A0A2I2FWG3_9EURO|nr:amine oxidase [Aspergillus steynii IBT 23096]PLB44947.1 amine oxidase [Aspergillus steynii IBT 23096]
MSRSKEGYLWTPTTTTEGLVTSSVQPSSQSTKRQYDAIVIGAGFAGLIAARDLCQTQDLTVLLLEARDRIGGRTWTANVLGEEIEMGGTWVHWGQPHVYAELHRYGLHRNLKTSAGFAETERQTFTTAEGVVEDVSIAESAEAVERIAEKVFSIDGLSSRALMPYPHDSLREPALWKRYDHLSVKDRLDALGDRVPRGERELFESNIGTFGSALCGETGFVDALRWYALGGHTMAGTFERAGMYKLGNGGMTSFAEAILGEYTGDRLFDTAVSEIRHTAKGVEVLTARGERFKAKTIVSTIPLNCLGDITFNPPLSPIRQAAVAQGHINKGAKIHFKLRETLPGWIWTGSGYGDSEYVFAFSDHNGTQSSGPSGTWSIGFGYNGKLTDKSDSQHIINQFKKSVNSNVSVEAYATYDWMNDPYAKGVWACWGPKSASRFLEELQRPHDRIVFASADWADGWRGFIDGAIEQGQIAVREVVNLLKEQGVGKAKL